MLIASIAVSAGRASNLARVVASLNRQTVRPDLITVWYSTSPWHLDVGWSSEPKVESEIPCEIRDVRNIGSCRKYLCALERFSGETHELLLLDDDHEWGSTVVEKLVRYKTKHDVAVTTRGWSSYEMIPNRHGQLVLHNHAIDASINTPTVVRVTNSGWATLFTTTDVDSKILDPELQESYLVAYSDEVFLSAMLPVPKVVVPQGPGWCRELPSELHQWLSPETGRAKVKQLELLK